MRLLGVRAIVPKKKSRATQVKMGCAAELLGVKNLDTLTFEMLAHPSCRSDYIVGAYVQIKARMIGFRNAQYHVSRTYRGYFYATLASAARRLSFFHESDSWLINDH